MTMHTLRLLLDRVSSQQCSFLFKRVKRRAGWQKVTRSVCACGLLQARASQRSDGSDAESGSGGAESAVSPGSGRRSQREAQGQQDDEAQHEDEPQTPGRPLVDVDSQHAEASKEARRRTMDGSRHRSVMIAEEDKGRRMTSLVGGLFLQIQN